jgi:flagellar hook-associated protein 1 FlgK
MLLDQRDSVSAVSLDEEGANLIQYQKAYNAIARVMTAFDEMLDILINRVGVVGR